MLQAAELGSSTDSAHSCVLLSSAGEEWGLACPCCVAGGPAAKHEVKLKNEADVEDLRLCKVIGQVKVESVSEMQHTANRVRETPGGLG